LLNKALILSGLEKYYDKILEEIGNERILFLTEDINYPIAKVLLRTYDEMIGLYSRRSYYNKVITEVKEKSKTHIYIYKLSLRFLKNIGEHIVHHY